MSVTLMGSVFDQTLPPSQKLLLLAMADHARDDGTGCYPSVGRLAKKTSMTRRGVQGVMKALRESGIISPVKVRKDGVIEYRITIKGANDVRRGGANDVRRGEPRSQRTGLHKGGEPRSPEPKDEPKTLNKRPSRSTKADPRFQPIIDHYFARSRAKAIEPDFDQSDAGALSRWLSSNKLDLRAILHRLDNAFASTDPYPLKPGFRLREFLSHSAKYAGGPIARGHRDTREGAGGDDGEAEPEYAKL